MYEQKEIQDLAMIRSIMERSTKFLSLSGLSGIAAGVYALLGATVAFPIVYRDGKLAEDLPIASLAIIGLVVATASILSGLWINHRRAIRAGHRSLGPAAKRLAYYFGVPLLCGAAVVCILLHYQIYLLVPSTMLVFYGVAVFVASNFTFSSVQYLGLAFIVTGLICAFFPGYGLYFWAFGFGMLHIIYGFIMYSRQRV